MLERATSIFALAICFFCCATQAATQSPSSPPQPPLLPDLTISDISLRKGRKDNTPDLAITNLFLNPQRKLSVTLVNLRDNSISLAEGSLKIAVDGVLKQSYTLRSLSDQSSLPAKGSITLATPSTLVGRHEVLAYVEFTNEAKEPGAEGNSLKRILDGPPVGPDIVVKDLDLTEDLELTIVLSNAGQADLRKGATFQIQVFVNGQKVSEFDHFISEVLMAHFGNRYAVAPPYRVEIAGTSKVKVSISPELSSDDICSENNTFEKTFLIFPFKIAPRDGEGFTFSIPLPSARGEGHAQKVRAEVRWEGGSSALMISFKLSGILKEGLTLWGRNPLKVEIPIAFEELQGEGTWSVLVTNPGGKKVEGYLIIQHP